ncbi:MAG: hypothetical protein ACLFUJ_07970 [Phycisphaerae bacterium]
MTEPPAKPEPHNHPHPPSDPADRPLWATTALLLAWPAMLITGLLVFSGSFYAFQQGLNQPEPRDRLISFAGSALIPAIPLLALFLLRKQPFFLPFRTALLWYLAVQAFSILAYLTT